MHATTHSHMLSHVCCTVPYLHFHQPTTLTTRSLACFLQWQLVTCLSTTIIHPSNLPPVRTSNLEFNYYIGMGFDQRASPSSADTEISSVSANIGQQQQQHASTFTAASCARRWQQPTSQSPFPRSRSIHQVPPPPPLTFVPWCTSVSVLFVVLLSCSCVSVRVSVRVNK